MIVIRYHGGLGNQLFQFAAATALAKFSGTTVLSDPVSYARGYHQGASNCQWRDFELSRLGLSQSVRPCYAGRVTEVRGYRRIRNMILDGWRPVYQCSGKFDCSFWMPLAHRLLLGCFQDVHYFIDQKDEILSEIEMALSRLHNPEDLDGVIHVRRGDYLADPGFYSSWFEQYFVRAVSVLESQGRCKEIHVFSDDVEWCKSNLHARHAKLIFREPDKCFGGARDIISMSRARVLCIPNSTFSWWAAALASRHSAQVFAPSVWTSSCDDPVSRLYFNDWNVLSNQD